MTPPGTSETASGTATTIDERPSGDGATAGDDLSAESSRPSTDELPPGPDGLPIVGNTVQFVRAGPFEFYDRLATHGDVVGYSIAGRDFCTVLHPDYVEQVLVRESESFERFFFDDLGFDFAPEGLVQTTGEQWRRQRTLIQPAFTPERIAGYADAFAEDAERTVDGWADGEEIALNRELSTLTLSILSRSLFDLDVRESEGATVVTRAARTLNERADSRSLGAFLPDWVPTPANRRYRESMARFRETVDDLIARRRAAPEEYEDLLAILLDAEDESGRTMSDEEVRDQMITFLFAGHETTSLALTYAFLLLARYDQVREKLDAEHERVLGGAAPTLADLADLEYTETVIDEAMRLYPPAYVMFREALEDVEIGGYRVPEGTVVTLPQFRLHVDDRFYDDPERFRPERWTDEFEEQLPEYAYFPFGGGPRHCIGMRFALMELKTVLPVIAQRVDFELISDPEPELSAGITLQPDEDVRMRVSKR